MTAKNTRNTYIPLADYMKLAAEQEAARQARAAAWAARPKVQIAIRRSVPAGSENYTLRPDVECQSQACDEWRYTYGETRVHEWFDNHARPSFMPDAIGWCEGCGGYFNEAGKWAYQCSRCGKEMQAGELVGLFVPHNCPECEQEVSRTSPRCSLCRQPLNKCCC